MKNRSSGSDEGKQISDIPNFYDILELYHKSEIKQLKVDFAVEKANN